MIPPATSSLGKSKPLTDSDLDRLESLLDALPAPLQPLDVSALDGYLCGVLLQPRPVPADRWLALVVDVDGHPVPAGVAVDELHALVRRRHAELDHAISQREWFDPWIYEMEDSTTPSDSVLPWVAGFAAAMGAFPALMDMSHKELVEPLALLFMHFDPADLEDADALLEMIETLEPAADLGEAVQDVVRALMLMADVTRPRALAPRSARPPRPARTPRKLARPRR